MCYNHRKFHLLVTIYVQAIANYTLMLKYVHMHENLALVYKMKYKICVHITYEPKQKTTIRAVQLSK